MNAQKDPSILATLRKPPTEWFCLPQFCVGVGNDFKVPFAPEGYENTPETVELVLYLFNCQYCIYTHCFLVGLLVTASVPSVPFLLSSFH